MHQPKSDFKCENWNLPGWVGVKWMCLLELQGQRDENYEERKRGEEC